VFPEIRDTKYTVLATNPGVPATAPDIISVPIVRPLGEDIVNILLVTDNIVNSEDTDNVTFAVTFKLAFVVKSLIAVPLRAFASDDATVTTLPDIEAIK
jgi:hypothetical protein